MESFKWGTHFETGLLQVDKQHKTLVDMINGFSKGVAEDSLSEEFIFSAIKKLADYAQSHFDTEEQLMAAKYIDIRHMRMHLQQHNGFVDEVSAIVQTLDIKQSEDYKPLLAYLVHWLAYHILGADKNMARQIKAIDMGAEPATAYEVEEKGANSSTEPLLGALNSLFTLVSERNKALRELNLTLEQKVAERTAELEEANQALEQLSVTDHLTSLPNRRFAMIQLQLLWEESIIKGFPLACLMIDADDFKIINDTYGHDAGDVVLRRLAQELKDSVRSDDIVCRLGGDEFVILCPNTDLEGALILAEETRKKVARLKVSAGEGRWNGSISVGVAGRSRAMKSIHDLLKTADEAVYTSKRAGRNCVRS